MQEQHKKETRRDEQRNQTLSLPEQTTDPANT